jgi:hypothetical protein
MRRLHTHGAMDCWNWAESRPVAVRKVPENLQTLTTEMPRRIDSGFGGAAPLLGAASPVQQVPSALSQEN